ncbi:hypothetical protein [Marinilactibacillus kalidii]|uniref:hypothetical protein n=1 Tax=Marinilactibacillus kalidii TaxID=2820274 RepID=UPI001ABDA75C|nr:hypothetical protein [Marinilactibacillus kalidii]
MKKQLIHFIRLVNFEFERMIKFLFGIIAIVIVSNLIGSIIVPLSYMSEARETMSLESLNVTQFLEMYPSFSISTVTNSLWIYGPLALGISGFLFYSIYIWYREWLGKNTFVYRLLMLPIPRIFIFFSKLFTVFIGIFSLLSIQYVMIRLFYFISPSLVSSDLYKQVDVSEVISSHRAFAFLFPESFGLFAGLYSIGLVFLLVLFTGILLERSFRITGFIYGIVYAVISLVLIVLPSFIPTIFKNQYILYPSEILLLIIAAAIIVSVVSIFLSKYLLEKKITV